MRQSMTAFAAAQGAGCGFAWSWELRSVNGKGLELRLRLPDWIEGLEAALRKRIGQSVSRGSVQLSLRVQADDGAATASVDAAHLATVLDALHQIETSAQNRGLTLAPTSAAEILSQRGVLTHEMPQAEVAPPTFVLFVNDKRLIGKDYLRYLENRIREELPFSEVPIRFVLRDKRESPVEETT